MRGCQFDVAANEEQGVSTCLPKIDHSEPEAYPSCEPFHQAAHQTAIAAHCGIGSRNCHGTIVMVARMLASGEGGERVNRGHPRWDGLLFGVGILGSRAERDGSTVVRGPETVSECLRRRAAEMDDASIQTRDCGSQRRALPSVS